MDLRKVFVDESKPVCRVTEEGKDMMAPSKASSLGPSGGMEASSWHLDLKGWGALSARCS